MIVRSSVCGPTGSKSWPISQGSNIAPRLLPTRNRPVILPVMAIRRPASDIVVGKTEPNDSPSPSVPTQMAAHEPDQAWILPALISAPIRSNSRMVRGLR